MTVRFRHIRSAAAFTLVEMLVATVVLVLLVIMVTQLVNGTNGAITGSTKHISSDDQARAVFDRMGRDFANMPKRKDIDCSSISKATGNDSMFFYSEAPAFFDNSPSSSAQSTVALVGYCINPNYQLLRLGKGLTWDGTPTASGGGIVFLPTTISGTNAWNSVLASGTTSSPDPDFHVLANGVFRIEFTYQLKNGTLSDSPVISPDMVVNGQPVSSSGSMIGFQDVSAIVVAIAILDPNSQKVVSKTAAFSALIPGSSSTTALADSGNTVSPGSPPAQSWETSMSSPSFYSGLASAGIPLAAAQQIRIYQRYFYLNTQP